MMAEQLNADWLLQDSIGRNFYNRLKYYNKSHACKTKCLHVTRPTHFTENALGKTGLVLRETYFP